MESAHRHRRPAVGLVLLVLLGGRAGGLTGAGRLRRGQQLAGRLHPLAAGSGPTGHHDRLGTLGPDRARHRPCGKFRRCNPPQRGRLRIRSAAAPRPRLLRLRADYGQPVVDGLRRAEPVRRSVRLHRTKHNGHKQTAGRARGAASGRVAHPGAATDLRSGQPDFASQRRSRPAALRVRPGLTGCPRTTYPHRDRNGNTHLIDRHHHHYHSRFGGAAVRKAGARGSRLTSRGGLMELEDRAHPLTRGQLDIWLAQETGRFATEWQLGLFVRIEGRVDRDALEWAIRRAVREAEPARAAFFEEDGQVFQRAIDYPDVELAFYDLSGSQHPAQEAYEIASSVRCTPMPFTGPLFKFALFRTRPDEFYWFTCCHHAVIDGSGVALVRHRAVAIYSAIVSGAPIPPAFFGSLQDLVNSEL